MFKYGGALIGPARAKSPRRATFPESADGSGYLCQRVPSNSIVYDETRTVSPRTMQPGRYYTFDGSDDVLNGFGDLADVGTGSISITCWVKAATVADHCIVNHKGHRANNTDAGYSLYMNSLGRVVWAIADGTTRAYQQFPTGTVTSSAWVHLGAVLDRSDDSMHIYIDGVEYEYTPIEGPVSAIGSLSNASYDFLVGTDGNGNNPLVGNLFDLRIYESALGASDIASVYAFQDISASPTLWLKCDDTSATVCYDSSGNANHGDKSNITASTFNAEGETVPYSYQNEVGHGSVENMFTYSNSYTGGDWQTTNITITPNATEDPWGGNTGVKLEVTATASVLLRNEAAVLNDGYHTFVAYAKKGSGSGDGQIFIIRNITTATNLTSVTVNYDTGAKTVTLGNDGDVEVEALNNGWYRILVSSNLISAGDTITGYFGYPGGSRTAGIYVYGGGAQLYEGHLSAIRDYVLTTDTAYYYPIPRDEGTPAQDIAGSSLGHQGEAPRNAALVESNCATFDGTDDKIVSDDAGSSVPIKRLFLRFYNGSDITSATAGQQIVGTYNATVTYTGVVLGTATGSLTNEVITILHGSVPRAGVLNITITSGWHTLDIQWDGSRYDIFLDGVQQSVTAVGTEVQLDAQQLSIGERIATPGTAFPGRICDVQVYDNSDELILHWPCAEGGGATAYDISGNDRHGTVTNATLSSFWGNTQDVYHHNITKGFAQVATFNSTNDTVSFGDVYDMDPSADTVTFSFWFRADSLGNQNRIFNKRNTASGTPGTNGYLVYFNSSNVFKLITDDGTTVEQYDSSVVIPDLNWHHYALVVDAGSFSYFLDGALADTTTYSSGDTATATALSLGQGSSSSIIGSLFDCRIYTAALSTSDIASLYAGDETSTTPALHIEFQDGSGTTVTDSGSGGTDGTLTSSDAAAFWGQKVPRDGSILPISNPAGAYHNNAETAIDFTGGVAAPWWNTLQDELSVTIPTSYNYGDSLPSNMSKVTGTNLEKKFIIKGS